MTAAARAALDALERDGFGPGAAWQAAHRVAQDGEGDRLHDWLHGLVHRIEGDPGNAAYWYRRAGLETPSGSFAEEAARLRAALG